MTKFLEVTLEPIENGLSIEGPLNVNDEPAPAEIPWEQCPAFILAILVEVELNFPSATQESKQAILMGLPELAARAAELHRRLIGTEPPP
jgi:hypothetical protein